MSPPVDPPADGPVPPSSELPASGAPPASPFEDRGFLLGDGLFETIRLYGDRPFRLNAHVERLRAGARRVGIPVPDRLGVELASALAGWRERRPSEAAYGSLRITLTRGSGAGVLPPEEATPTLVLMISIYSPDPDLPARGLRAALRGRVDERALTSGLKGIGYLERIVALRDARASGAEEALLVNSEGRVVEGSASNIFVLRDGVLHTPSVGEGALPGITRAAVIAIAARHGIPLREEALTPGDVVGAEEVFLTSSLRELAPVVAVEGEPIGTGTPGAVYRALHDSFTELVRSDE